MKNIFLDLLGILSTVGILLFFFFKREKYGSVRKNSNNFKDRKLLTILFAYGLFISGTAFTIGQIIFTITNSIVISILAILITVILILTYILRKTELKNASRIEKKVR